jgi:glycosyltransferase involved in cell wall biosynthesis
LKSGWFSDRSACYLAAGRPVVTEDTGFADYLPVGEGLLAYEGMEKAVECIREIEADPARHRNAARAIAREYFDAAKVLSRLLQDVDLGTG